MRALVWLGSTQRDLREAPGSVRRTIGRAIRTAQQGGKSDLARAMHGVLCDVMEIRDDDAAGTYRLMYTIKLDDWLFILDFFQEKSKNGIGTPQADLDRIRLRLKKAREMHAAEE